MTSLSHQVRRLVILPVAVASSHIPDLTVKVVVYMADEGKDGKGIHAE